MTTLILTATTTVSLFAWVVAEHQRRIEEREKCYWRMRAEALERVSGGVR